MRRSASCSSRLFNDIRTKRGLLQRGRASLQLRASALNICCGNKSATNNRINSGIDEDFDDLAKKPITDDEIKAAKTPS